MWINDHRICFVGDSYTQGTADPDCLGWVGRVCANGRSRNHNITAYNLGIRSDTSSDIAKRWHSECSARLSFPNTQPYIVFSFGINDTTIENGRQRVPTQQTLQNLRHMLSQAQQLNYKTLFIGPAPMADNDTPNEINAQNERVHKLCQLMQKAARQINIPYLPIFDTLINDKKWLAEVAATDGAHPSVSGYAKLAKMVENWELWWFK